MWCWDCLQQKRESHTLTTQALFVQVLQMSFFRSSGIHPNYPFLRPVLDDMFLVATPDPPSQRLQGLMQNLIGFPQGCALLKYIPSKEGSQSTSAKLKLTRGKFQESSHCFSKILPCNKATCWLQIGWVGSRSTNFNACGCGKFHQEQLWHEILWLQHLS